MKQNMLFEDFEPGKHLHINDAGDFIVKVRLYLSCVKCAMEDCFDRFVTVPYCCNCEGFWEHNWESRFCPKCHSAIGDEVKNNLSRFTDESKRIYGGGIGHSINCGGDIEFDGFVHFIDDEELSDDCDDIWWAL